MSTYFVNFANFLLLMISNFTPLWSENPVYLFNLCKNCFRFVVYPEECSMDTCKEYVFYCFRREHCINVKSGCFIVLLVPLFLCSSLSSCAICWLLKMGCWSLQLLLNFVFLSLILSSFVPCVLVSVIRFRYVCWLVFICFWLLWVFIAFVWAFSSWSQWELLFAAGFSLQWLLLLQSTGSRHMGFRNCSIQPH